MVANTVPAHPPAILQQLGFHPAFIGLKNIFCFQTAY
jgi:hypothetical protein